MAGVSIGFSGTGEDSDDDSSGVEDTIPTIRANKEGEDWGLEAAVVSVGGG